MKKNISKSDLERIFSNARLHYVNDSAEFLTPQAFVAQCYLKAVTDMLGVAIEIPNRVISEPIDDING